MGFGFFDNILYAIQTRDFYLFLSAVIVLASAIFSIVLHELAHGYAARKNGDMTAYVYGRMTLNPVKHFDLFGFLCFVFAGFGWAKPVPVDSRNFHNYRKGMFWVSVAGVLANLALAFLSMPLMLVALLYLGGAPLWQNLLYSLGYGLFSINMLLFVFNLLPIYPLDGFRLIESRLRGHFKFKNFMYEYGTYLLLAFLIVSFFVSFMFGFSILGWIADVVGWPIEQFWYLVFGV